ncbi:hypothetical protein CMU04_06395 [Elizabethkingia anophelis]|nr:hypothetical protein [Elizabethkingia anophelis]
MKLKIDNEKLFKEFNPLPTISPKGHYTIKSGKTGTPVAMLPIPQGGVNGKERIEIYTELLVQSKAMAKTLIEVNDFLYNYKYKSVDDAYKLQSKVLALLKKLTTE